ncbi:hypothetical protein [Sphingobium boeckii]|uniref:DUF3108 domain-containing protein n=1 Tax=Sphingobium boeckii TaxID=1082345 RepID=A0A7W9EG11_9SPHN|nr:hypothetical protein [Sphingobium boeckii]MBB5687694.1 hypothetical protein [Sphingobium boeckii]
MQHRSLVGKILYTSMKPGREGQERGREDFTFTVHPDGSRTVRALCEIEEPAPTVLRDITCSFDANDRPTDCFVRLMIDDRFLGAGLFRFTQDAVECESFGPSIGRVSQTMPLGGSYDGVGMHPISGDAYIVKMMDKARGPHSRVVRSFIPSPDHRGVGAPLIGEGRMQCTYLGDENVTVKAGRFEASHFRFTDPETQSHPDYDIWVTADDDAIFLKGGVGGYMQTWYELVALHQR